MKLSLQMADVNSPASPGSAAAVGASVMKGAGTTPTANTPSSVQHYFDDVEEVRIARGALSFCARALAALIAAPPHPGQESAFAEQ